MPLLPPSFSPLLERLFRLKNALLRLDSALTARIPLPLLGLAGAVAVPSDLLIVDFEQGEPLKSATSLGSLLQSVSQLFCDLIYFISLHLFHWYSVQGDWAGGFCSCLPFRSL